MLYKSPGAYFATESLWHDAAGARSCTGGGKLAWGTELSAEHQFVKRDCNWTASHVQEKKTIKVSRKKGAKLGVEVTPDTGKVRS